MPIIRAADATVTELHGARFTSHARPATGTGQLCVWQVDIGADTPGTAHRITREEVLVVTAGSLRVTIDGDTTTATAGDTVIVPAGATLRLDAEGARPASAIVATTTGIEAVLADGTRLAPPWTR